MPLAVLSDKAPNRESCRAERFVALDNGVAPGYRHVVDHPLMHVGLVNTLLEKFQLLGVRSAWSVLFST